MQNNIQNRNFYNEILTEHNMRPEFKYDLPAANVVLEGVNPNCGDDIWLRDVRKCSVSQVKVSLDVYFFPVMCAADGSRCTENTNTIKKKSKY